MPARLIHLGSDTSHRLKVLRRAGYHIDACNNLIEFRTALRSDPEADAVLLNDSDGSVPLEAISLARSRSSAPIILFPHIQRVYGPADVDLTVPGLTPPEEWLLDLANLIVRFRAIRAYSQLLHEHAELLRSETAAVCEKSRMEMERSRMARERSRMDSARNADLLGRDPGN